MKSQYQAKKRFGQHFLRNSTIIQQIIDAIWLAENQNIVEIGPGLGALTTRLLPLVKQLNIIELDRDLVPKLQKNCAKLGHLMIHNEDALTFDFASLKNDSRKLRIVGNLPYNISSPLLFHLLKYADIIADMHFMLQKEVADRLSACVGTSSYGRLSIMVQYYCGVEPLFDVSPDAFEPKPKVYSSFIRLIPHQTLPHPAKDFSLFAEMVKTAFSMRRKQLQNALKGFITAEALSMLNINPTLRPEQIGVADYVALANYLTDL